MNMIDLPIPGENFTSDTKSYPWHQPPEFRNIGNALDKISVKITAPKVARRLVALGEMGFPLWKIAQMIIMEGMAQGKWTADMALLLAGPITKIIEIMCEAYGVEYTLGIEDDDDFTTGEFFKGLANLEKESKDRGVYKIVKEELPNIKQAAEGQEDPEAPPAEEGGGEEPDIMQEGFAAMNGTPPEENEEAA